MASYVQNLTNCAGNGAKDTRLVRELTDPIVPVQIPSVLVGQLHPRLLVPNFAR